MASNIKTYGISTKPIEVPQALQDGEKFIKWDEDSPAVGVPVTLRVDPKGFFLYWTDQNMEVEMLDIATIRDVRTGNYAKVPKDAKLRGVLTMGSGNLEEKTISVCCGSDFVNVYFVNFCCTKKEVAVMWMESLFSMAYNIHTANLTAMRVLEKVHTRIVLRADKTGKIAIKNIIRALTGSKEERRRVEKALSEAGLPAGKADMVAATKFTFDDFFAFYKCLMQRTEIQELFDQLSEGKAWIGAGALAAFLNGPQRDPRLNEILHPYADLPRAKDLIRQHEPNKYHRARDQLSSDGFLRLLMCEESGLVARWRLEPLEDMEQPLAHYFINSSHNTYLTGHQITGRSSVEIYRQALLAGCRCVELDFWNGRTEEPIIVHGYTFVPEVPARDVLEAIAESAFKTSPYPVVLSFENHCNPRQQARIAAYCREIFKDMLLEEPLKSHPLRAGGVLPSPAQLKHKIIIKNKKQHHHHKHSEPPSPSSSGANGDLQEFAEDTLEEKGASQGLLESSSSSSSSSEETEGEEEGGDGEGERQAKGEVHPGSELSALVNYVQPVHFTSFENAEKKNRFYEMSSFDEKAATTLLKERPVEFVNYNKTQLSRVYPAGTRFDSSNFMPQVFWNAGCQLVALNYQTLDLPMQLNVAAFEYNGRSGYLLKPDIMRRLDRKLDLFAENTVDGVVAGSLSVRVVSAQFASEKKVGLYVEVDLLGLPGDTVRKRYRTRVVAGSAGSALCPRFEEAAFSFPRVVAPELAWLRVALLEDGGRLVGHRVAPLTAIRPGWRHVVLRSELGAPLSATLLLQLSVADYVPDALADLADALANPIRYQSELERRAQTLAALYDEHQPSEGDSIVAEKTKLSAKSKTPSDATAATATAAAAKTNSIDFSPAYNSSSGITTSVPAPSGEADGGGSDSDASNCSEGSVSARAEAEVARVLQCRSARNLRSALARKLARLHAPRRMPRLPRLPHLPHLPHLPRALARTLSALSVARQPLSESGSGTSPSGSSAPASSSAPSSAAGSNESLRSAERALRLRYHTTIYAALERHARHLEEQQMKQLTVELESERKSVLARLAATRRDEVRHAARGGGADARRRAQRDAHTASVERGVLQMEKLERRYARRRLALAAAHARANATIDALRDQELLELEKLCGESSGG